MLATYNPELNLHLRDHVIVYILATWPAGCGPPGGGASRLLLPQSVRLYTYILESFKGLNFIFHVQTEDTTSLNNPSLIILAFPSLKYRREL